MGMNSWLMIIVPDKQDIFLNDATLKNIYIPGPQIRKLSEV